MATNNRGQARLETYQDKKGEWRWRVWRGSRIVAESGEGYARPDSLQRALSRLKKILRVVVKDRPSRQPARRTKVAA